MKGKTARSKLDVVDIALQKIDVSRSIMRFCRDIELEVDVMCVNDVLFLTTISSNIHYRTIAALCNVVRTSLEQKLTKVIRSHVVRGCKISLVVVDMKFKPVKDRNLLGTLVNVAMKEEHMAKE